MTMRMSGSLIVLPALRTPFLLLCFCVLIQYESFCFISLYIYYLFMFVFFLLEAYCFIMSDRKGVSLEEKGGPGMRRRRENNQGIFIL